MIELFTGGGATTSLGSVLFSNVGFFWKAVGQRSEKIQGLNSEFKLITPKPITETYFETNLSRFDLAGLPIVVILYL